MSGSAGVAGVEQVRGERQGRDADEPHEVQPQYERAVRLNVLEHLVAESPEPRDHPEPDDELDDGPPVVTEEFASPRAPVDLTREVSQRLDQQRDRDGDGRVGAIDESVEVTFGPRRCAHFGSTGTGSIIRPSAPLSAWRRGPACQRGVRCGGGSRLLSGSPCQRGVRCWGGSSLPSAFPPSDDRGVGVRYRSVSARAGRRVCQSHAESCPGGRTHGIRDRPEDRDPVVGGQVMQGDGDLAAVAPGRRQLHGDGAR